MSNHERGRILVFFHGHALAHTIRPLVVARALRERGFEMVFAGAGAHAERVRTEGFAVREIPTMPQERMDEFVLGRGREDYHDTRWVERLVGVERELMREVRPALALVDLRRTVRLSAALEGVDTAEICNAYLQPGNAGIERPGRLDRWREQWPFLRVGLRHADAVRPTHRLALMADVPEFHPPPAGTAPRGWHYVGPLDDRPLPADHVAGLDDGWDTARPLVYLTLGSSGRPAEFLAPLMAAFAQSPYRLVVTTGGRWRAEGDGENVRVFDYLPGEWILARAQLLVGVVGIGAIYQALRRGRPVLGFGEHADHRAHLARIEALGLGRSMEREGITPDAVLAAVDALLHDVGGFRARCREFAGNLAAWDGGGVAADVLERHLAAPDPPRLDRLAGLLHRAAALRRPWGRRESDGG
ncbi:MAG: hypothetical protein QF903_15415 [Planctomycetota bacterium]|jgi:UDP:flavonoid glycosyltransferase YjiC (YdhE family)|nr:hypothetical protein [Planctomycetota bacterium]